MGRAFKSGIYIAGDRKTLMGFEPRNIKVRFVFYKDLSEHTSVNG